MLLNKGNEVDSPRAIKMVNTIILEVKIRKLPNKNLFYYPLLGAMFFICEYGYSTEIIEHSALKNNTNTCVSERGTCNGCSNRLPLLVELKGENSVRTFIKSLEKDEKIGQGCQVAFNAAKYYASHGSSEGFQYYMSYLTQNGLELFTKENLKLIEKLAIEGNEGARGYFVEAYRFGGKGRIVIEESEQNRTQKLIEQFASEGFKGALEYLQYLKLSQLLKSSTEIQ